MLFYRGCTRSAFHNEVSRFDMAEGDREFCQGRLPVLS